MRFFHFISVALLLWIAPALAAVFSWDLGTEWSKVALVSPTGLDIVLNPDSKRKTQAVVSLRNEERRHGSDAATVGARFPANAFPSLKMLLGVQFDDPAAERYRSIYGNEMIRDPIRGGIAFKYNETTSFTVEELLAMQFSHIKEQAEATHKDTIIDAVVAIPPFYKHSERQAILDAAAIAGIRLVGLVNDGTAVAVNYAMKRQFTIEPQHIIFYDQGAGSTTASLISFSNITVKDVGKFNKTVTQIEVMAVACDRHLGGLEFDVRLQKYFAQKFQEIKGKKLSSSVLSNPRAMSRLLKEANRVKQILSANQEAHASVENLMEDQDFRLKVTRAEFEGLISDLIPTFDNTIRQVLDQSGLMTEELEALILIGGSSRVPSVQASLSALVGDDKIAKTINADEAATFGAAYYGAGLSKQYKIRESRIKDKNLYPIEVAYELEPKDKSEAKKIHSVLFGNSSVFGQKKIMTFKRTTDFDFDLSYAGSASEDIVRYHVEGLTDAMKEIEKSSVDTPKVKITLQLTESGFVRASDAIATIETETAPTIADKVKSFFGGAKSDDASDEADEESTTTSEASASTTASVNATEAAPKVKVEKVSLKLKAEYLGFPPLSSEDKFEKRKRLEEMDNQDKLKRALETSRNELEAFVYRGREFLENDLVNTLSTEEQRDALRKKLSEVSDWLYDSDDANIGDFVRRLSMVKALYNPISERKTEHLGRSEAVSRLEKMVDTAKTFAETLTKNLEETEEALRAQTPEEIEKLKDLAADSSSWMAEKTKEQTAKLLHETPAFLMSEIDDKVEALQKEITRLLMKRPPKPKKTKTTSAKASTTSSTATASVTTSATTAEGPASSEDEEKKHDEL